LAQEEGYKGISPDDKPKPVRGRDRDRDERKTYELEYPTDFTISDDAVLIKRKAGNEPGMKLLKSLKKQEDDKPKPQKKVDQIDHSIQPLSKVLNRILKLG
jgi:hypothetical protein